MTSNDIFTTINNETNDMFRELLDDGITVGIKEATATLTMTRDSVRITFTTNDGKTIEISNTPQYAKNAVQMLVQIYGGHSFEEFTRNAETPRRVKFFKRVTKNGYAFQDFRKAMPNEA